MEYLRFVSKTLGVTGHCPLTISRAFTNVTRLIRRVVNLVRDAMPLHAVSFAQISRILELTDRLGLNREWVEIPLSPESPGLVRRLANGKLEIVVDADQPFESWLGSLAGQIHQIQGS